SEVQWKDTHRRVGILPVARAEMGWGSVPAVPETRPTGRTMLCLRFRIPEGGRECIHNAVNRE
ncbi:MAG: hypothetical protein ABGZ53_33215, partial [Fuerstiella sp.]